MNLRAAFSLLVLAACASAPPQATADAPAPIIRASGPGATPESASPPLAGRSFVVPTPHAFALPNGMQVVVIERHDVSDVALQMVVPRGADDARPRVGSLTMEAFLRSHRESAGKTARERLDALAATASSWGTLDSTGVRIQVAREKLEPALAILADALLRPTFDAKDIEIVRAEMLAEYEREKNALATVHRWAVRNALYPVGHPYREAGSDRAADIRAVTRQDIMLFASSHLTPNGMTAIVAGDITPAALRSALLGAFETWTGAPTKRPPPPPPVPVAADPMRRVFLVSRRAAAQTYVSVVAPSIARAAENYPAMLVFNRILGGTESSRLGKNLREQKGIASSVGSEVTTRHGAGELIAGGVVVKERAAAAIREIMKELALLATEPVPADELKTAIDGLVQEVPSMFETLDATVHAYGEAPVHALSRDELVLRAIRIAAVTSEDVMRIARKYFDRKALRVVVTGDAAVVRKDLEALGLGPVLTIDPVPGKR